MNKRAQRLLDAHVAHELQQLEGERFAALVENLIGEAFRWFSEVRLQDAVIERDVMATVERYVITLRVSGGITELAGEMARLVVASDANTRHGLKDILSASSFEEITEHLLTLDPLRKKVIGLVAHSQTLSEVVARVVSHELAGALRRGAERFGTQSSVAKAVQRSLAPGLEQYAHDLVARLLERHHDDLAERVERELIASLDAEALRSLADEAWQQIASLRLSETFALLGEQQLEDLVVFVYEFWARFRQTPYFQQVLRECVAGFFRKYGGGSVGALIEDMGVTPEMIVLEAKTLLPPCLAQAKHSGFLEAELRKHLASFYASDACAAALAAP
jgi:hypothetical protein